jgi:8-oxo-dGTP diphosphatase
MKLVAAAIAFQDGRVLVTRRAPGEKLAGLWEFPGGKLEATETPQSCIVRELREELHIDAEAGDVVAESIYEYPGGAIKLIGVAVSLATSDMKLTVHDAVDWVLPSELLGFELAPADIPIAEELVRIYG